MNSNIIRILDMLKRIYRLILDHPITPALLRATAAHAEIGTIIPALEAAAQNQTSGIGQAAGGVDLRVTYSRELRDFLKEVNRTARVLDEEHPGIRPTFRLPASGSYPALIAAAQSIIAAATPLHASFVEAGLPEDFLAELTALLTAFQTATAQKHDGRIAQVLSTAALKAQAALGMAAATKLDAYARNAFRKSPELLAAWKHARRVERAPRRSRAQTQTPPETAGRESSRAALASTANRVNAEEAKAITCSPGASQPHRSHFLAANVQPAEARCEEQHHLDQRNIHQFFPTGPSAESKFPDR